MGNYLTFLALAIPLALAPRPGTTLLVLVVFLGRNTFTRGYIANGGVGC